MKRIVVFCLCLLIVLSSFVLCFADFSPLIMPVGNSGGLKIPLSNGNYYSFSSSNSPTYVFWYKPVDTSYYVCLYFSDLSNTLVYRQLNDNTPAAVTLTSEHNGFYYTYNSTSVHPVDSYIYFPDTVMSVTDMIDYLNSSVFGVGFDLTYLVDGSVSWLSSMAQAVKTNGLLLFFVLTIFVGFGIGLFNRFRKE